MRDEEIVERQIGRKPRGFLRVATRCPLGFPETIVTRPIIDEARRGEEQERETQRRGAYGSETQGRETLGREMHSGETPGSEAPGRETGDRESVGHESGADRRQEGIEPFPTVFWLTCPGAVRAVSELEAQGYVRTLQDRLAGDPRAMKAYLDAARSYAGFRMSLLPAEEAAQLAIERPGHYEVVAESGVGGVLGQPGEAGIKCLHAHYADYLARGTNPVGRWVRELLVEKAAANRVRGRELERQRGLERRRAQKPRGKKRRPRDTRA
ncbi:MAG: DUF501 domain-containing protein [Bacillota bacterium]|nr:DUF501 domain-containing protein [Bacillota bacterium]